MRTVYLNLESFQSSVIRNSGSLWRRDISILFTQKKTFPLPLLLESALNSFREMQRNNKLGNRSSFFPSSSPAGCRITSQLSKIPGTKGRVASGARLGLFLPMHVRDPHRHQCPDRTFLCSVRRDVVDTTIAGEKSVCSRSLFWILVDQIRSLFPFSVG